MSRHRSFETGLSDNNGVSENQSFRGYSFSINCRKAISVFLISVSQSCTVIIIYKKEITIPIYFTQNNLVKKDQ